MTLEEFEDAWERAGPWFERALSYAPGLWTLADIKFEILNERAQFWANDTSAIVTNFVWAPRAKVLWFWLLGGTRAGLDELIPMAERWGIENDCTMAMGEGRKGFERAARPHGYRAISTRYVKDWSHGILQ